MTDDDKDAGDRVSIPLPFEEAVRGLLKVDPGAADPEAWAREHVQLTTTDHHKNGLTWVATIKADGLIFEGRATGPAPKRDALRERAAGAAVRDYLDFIERSSG
jgi:hypothetical protein